MHFKKSSLIAIAGGVWFMIGLLLLTKGLYLLFLTASQSGQIKTPLLSLFLYAFTGAIVPSLALLIVTGLLFGWIKARFGLIRSVRRTIHRLYPIEGTIKLSKLYRLHDYLLIVGMIALGRLMHWIKLPGDLHGFIDIAIGSALVNGAMIYFRFALKVKEQQKA